MLHLLASGIPADVVATRVGMAIRDFPRVAGFNLACPNLCRVAAQLGLPDKASTQRWDNGGIIEHWREQWRAKLLAFAMGVSHARLGEGSVLRVLDNHMAMMVGRHSGRLGFRVWCARHAFGIK